MRTSSHGVSHNASFSASHGSRSTGAYRAATCDASRIGSASANTAAAVAVAPTPLRLVSPSISALGVTSRAEAPRSFQQEHTTSRPAHGDRHRSAAASSAASSATAQRDWQPRRAIWGGDPKSVRAEKAKAPSRSAARQTPSSHDVIDFGASSADLRATARRAQDSALSLLARTADLLGAHKVLVIAAILAAVIVAALYPPLRSYYQAMRSSEALEATYAQVQEDNTTLQEDVDRLMTREGIEEEARKRGYVSEGETGAIVEVEGQTDAALAEAENDASSAADDSAADASISDAAADTPWYINVLDTIFGYEA